MPLHVTEELKLAVRRDPRNCILFVGAGLSRSGVRLRGRGLPDWDTLMRRMIRALREKCDVGTLTRLKELLSREGYLDIAREFGEHKRPDQYSQFLREQFNPPDLVPSELHETILETGFRGILTTNFDMVFESQSRRLQPLVYPQCLDDLDSFRSQGFFAKIHGSIDRLSDPRTDLVFTEESYLALRSNRKYHAILQSYFLMYTILTVGFSLRDPGFRGILDDLREILGEAMPTVYALMQKPPLDRRNEWRKKGVEIVHYEKHAELRRFFEEMLQLSEARYGTRRLTRPLLFPSGVSEVKQKAWEFYSDWRRSGGSISPRFGKVQVTLKGWRHITRVSRSQREVCHKLSLLPCAKQLIETCGDAARVRTIRESPRRGEATSAQGLRSSLLPPRLSRELYVLHRPYKSRFRADIIVEVILEITKKGDESVGATFLTVHEMRARQTAA